MTEVRMKVKMDASFDGDNGKSQLVFYCSKDIQKEFDGKLVELIISEPPPKRRKAK